MPVLQLTLTLDLDGRDLPDFSLVRRIQVDNATPFVVGQPSSASPVPLPAADVLTALNALLIRATDQAVIVAITDFGGGKTPSPVTINPGGVMLLFDVVVPIGANASPEVVTLTQNSTFRSLIKGLVAGVAE